MYLYEGQPVRLGVKVETKEVDGKQKTVRTRVAKVKNAEPVVID